MVQSLSMPLVKLHISNIKPRAFSYPFNPHFQTFNPSPQTPTSPLAPLANHQMNPHFAFSAIFALGLRGIANKSKLPYGPINSPGVTRETLIKLPTSLESATAQFKRKESLAREVMGDYFVDHFAGTREHELEVFRRAVTDWEGGSSFSSTSFSSSFPPCPPLRVLYTGFFSSWTSFIDLLFPSESLLSFTERIWVWG